MLSVNNINMADVATMIEKEMNRYPSKKLSPLLFQYMASKISMIKKSRAIRNVKMAYRTGVSIRTALIPARYTLNMMFIAILSKSNVLTNGSAFG